ncbi:MAG: hypothetical protein Q8M40_12305 [Legionella sp.]|nr:hypothetical protein [Legionella sp.]
MKELIRDLMTDPKRKALVIMPVARIQFDEAFAIDGFHFFPPEAVNLDTYNLVPNMNIGPVQNMSGIITLEGQDLRGVATSLTGFCLEILASSHLVAFTTEMDWGDFLDGDYQYDISLLKLISSRAERALDVIRLFYCRLDLPDTLPGQVGSWNGSNQYLGALLYSAENNESYIIAGAAVESSIVVRGLGLELDGDSILTIPNPSDGYIAGVALHALSLHSEALNASNETIKFIRIMTLFEFLASPDEYQNWKKIKGDIACHCVNDRVSYLKLCERFRELTSIEDVTGKQIGIRTLVVHNGKLLPELIPNPKERDMLFRELQGYALAVLNDMLSNVGFSWDEYVEHRTQLKSKLGVV